MLRLSRTPGQIPNKCNRLVWLGQFLKREHLVMVKRKQLNGKCLAWSPIHPSLSSSSPGRRRWGVIDKEDYQVRFPLTFLDWHRDHSMIILASILVLALQGARVVMAPRPHVGGGRGSISRLSKPLWRNALTKVTSSLLLPSSQLLLSFFFWGQIISAKVFYTNYFLIITQRLFFCVRWCKGHVVDSFKWW